MKQKLITFKQYLTNILFYFLIAYCLFLMFKGMILKNSSNQQYKIDYKDSTNK